MLPPSSAKGALWKTVIPSTIRQRTRGFLLGLPNRVSTYVGLGWRSLPRAQGFPVLVVPMLPVRIQLFVAARFPYPVCAWELVLLYATGARVGEACAITPEDVDLRGLGRGR
jgi:integrase